MAKEANVSHFYQEPTCIANQQKTIRTLSLKVRDNEKSIKENLNNEIISYYKGIAISSETNISKHLRNARMREYSTIANIRTFYKCENILLKKKVNIYIL